ncbi:MAG: phage tail tape measure protein [Pseudomonadota bacterium]
MAIDVALVLRLVDRASGPLRTFARNVDNVAGTLNNYESRRELIASNQAAQQHWRNEALAVGAMAFSLRQALQPAIGFEAAMGDVRKVIDFDGENGLALLGREVRSLSDDIPIASDGIAQIIAAAGQSNLVDSALPDDEERAQLIKFAEAAAQMGIAFNMAADQAGQRMAGLRNIFAQTQAETEALADATNHLSNSFNTTGPQILDVLNRTGGVSNLFGLQPEQLAALATGFLQMEVPSERASTAVENLLGRLQTAETGTDAFHEALESLGLDAGALSEAIEADAQGALLSFLETVKASENPLNVLTQMFGREVSDELAILVGGLDKYKEAVDAVADPTAFAGSMLAEYQIKADETGNQLTLLTNRLTNLSIVIGTEVLPILSDMVAGVTPVIQAFSDFSEANPELTRALFYGVAGLIAFKAATVAIMWPLSGLVGLFLRGWPLIRVLGAAAIWAGGKALPLLAGGFTAVMGVAKSLVALLVANPIGAAIALIAAGAFLIYRNWDGVAAWFSQLWDNVVAVFVGAKDFIVGAFSLDMDLAIQGIATIWSGLSGIFKSAWDGVIGIFRAAWAEIKPIVDAITGAFDLFGESDDQQAAAVAAAQGGRGRISDSIRRRAAGGPVSAGQLYQVNELGEELFVPNTAGTIVPAHRLSTRSDAPVAPAFGGRASAGSSGPVTINVHPSPGMDEAALARMVADEVRRTQDASADLHDGALMNGGHL